MEGDTMLRTLLGVSLLTCTAVATTWAAPPDGVGGPPDHANGPPTDLPGNGPGKGGGFTPPGQGGSGPPGRALGHDKPRPARPGDGVSSEGIDAAGRSHVAHAMFHLVDAEGVAIEDEEATWGRMMYFWVGPGFDFVFNAHNFEPNLEGDDSGLFDFVLTYQPEPIPSPGVLCLGSGTVNDEGDLHIAATLELESDLPPGVSALDPEDGELPVATLALVPANDVDCDTGDMLLWEPALYLFSTPVRYYDSNLE
jgi:hypothetical protein